ncbi:ribonuclease HI family protein [Bacillaceae bacterium SIJ1]|uniref:ribonuclease HI family protein n=1 Tax=Litoribacterium kuwaitense TaxID=1398745 RepID=UPI0013EDAC74|nr:ribonuclease HI family protein [Litoribacterium kuwaitense]NGP43766.1 ribonuclease HI family protein [Litoribacterium kuwaitense]
MADLYIDGASAGNPGPSGAGIVLINDGIAYEKAIPLPPLTNHEAEWHALIAGMNFCKEHGVRNVFVKTDSQLIERAIEKEYIKNPLYVPFYEQVLALSKHFDLFFVKWIPENKNKKADLLARHAIHLSKRS